MATTAVPVTDAPSNTLSTYLKKYPAIEELWMKLNRRVDDVQGKLGGVDVQQQATQAKVEAGAGTSPFGGISPWLIVGGILLLLWLWRRKK